MKLLGIDEAGRGPVLGSMFIGGVLVDSDDTETLEQLQLKDSKELADEQREDFVPQITEVATDTHVKEVTATEIDELREIMSLNMIEINGFAHIIDALGPDKVVIDLPEPNANRFVKKLRNQIDGDTDHIDMIAEHKADKNYPIVSAASILAKSQREHHITQLNKKYGANVDSGYPHDEQTTQFLEDHLQEHGHLPEETRESWSTAQRIKAENQQQGLGDFYTGHNSNV